MPGPRPAHDALVTPAEKQRVDLLTILRSTPDTLRGLTGGLSDPAARRGESAEDWSVAQVAAHLVDAERAWFSRIRLMREQDHPLLVYFPDLDITRPDLSESLAEIERRRQETVAYLEGLKPAEWRRGGDYKGRWGEITIAWAARHLAAHDAGHLAQIARRIQA